MKERKARLVHDHDFSFSSHGGGRCKKCHLTYISVWRHNLLVCGVEVELGQPEKEWSLTPLGQSLVEEWAHIALKCARILHNRWKRSSKSMSLDEFEAEALFGLCDAVAKLRPKHADLPGHLYVSVENRLRSWIRRFTHHRNKSRPKMYGLRFGDGNSSPAEAETADEWLSDPAWLEDPLGIAGPRDYETADQVAWVLAQDPNRDPVLAMLYQECLPASAVATRLGLDVSRIHQRARDGERRIRVSLHQQGKGRAF